MPACTRCSLRIIMAQKTFNILFLNSIASGVWGGLEHWMELAGVGLAGCGHRVVFAGRKDSLFLRRVAAHPETTTLPLSISGDFHPTAIKQLAEAAGRLRIDIVMCNFVKDVRLAGLARRLGTVKYRIVWTPGVNLARRSLSHRFLFAPFVDHVIVPSRALRDDIVKSGYLKPSSFDVIPIGIDGTIWHGERRQGREALAAQFNLPDTAFLCLTSGRFVRQKGHEFLVAAAKILAERHQDIFYVLLGSGPLQSDLMEQIKRHDLSDRFLFCGLLPQHQAVVLAADLYVHPAIVEPFGIVLVEAMAAGLPVVATRVGGIPEVVAEDETALLVEPADPAALAAAVERLYTDRTTRERLGNAGRRRFERDFRLSTMIDRLEACLREMVAA